MLQQNGRTRTPAREEKRSSVLVAQRASLGDPLVDAMAGASPPIRTPSQTPKNPRNQAELRLRPQRRSFHQRSALGPKRFSCGGHNWLFWGLVQGLAAWRRDRSAGAGGRPSSPSRPCRELKSWADADWSLPASPARRYEGTLPRAPPSSTPVGPPCLEHAERASAR